MGGSFVKDFLEGKTAPPAISRPPHTGPQTRVCVGHERAGSSSRPAGSGSSFRVASGSADGTRRLKLALP
jgi:hypothetical protein